MNRLNGFIFEFKLSLLVTLRDGGIFYKKRKYTFRPHSRTLQDRKVLGICDHLLSSFVRKHTPFGDADNLKGREWYYKISFEGSKKYMVVQDFLYEHCSALVHHYDATKHHKSELHRTRNVKISAFLVVD